MVDENTLRTIPGLDLVCVPNVVVVGPAVFAKNANINRQTDRHDAFYLFDALVGHTHKLTSSAVNRKSTFYLRIMFFFRPGVK